MDGTTWMINPGDLPSAMCWIPTTNVKIKKSRNDRFFDHVMINIDNMNEEILVRKQS